MNTERTEKFVNAIACDLEEGGFRQVSGTTLRRSLTEAVARALQQAGPAELAEQQGEVILHALADAYSAGAEGMQFGGLARLKALAGTPSSRWSADGQPDPHGDRYACERAALALGHLTDDELANAVYLHGNEQPSMADLVAGKALPGIVYLTAAKERIRWLSRALAASRAEVDGLRSDAARYAWIASNAEREGTPRQKLDAQIDSELEKGNV